MTAARVSFLVLLGGVAALALGWWRGWITVPPHYLPWEPLDIEAPLNIVTRFKLNRLSNDPRRCLTVLSTANVEYVPLDDRVTDEGCGFRNAVTVERTASEVSEPFSLSCRAAVSVALWERHVVHPAARAHLGQPVAKLEHFGSYSCRTSTDDPTQHEAATPQQKRST